MWITLGILWIKVLKDGLESYNVSITWEMTFITRVDENIYLKISINRKER